MNGIDLSHIAAWWALGLIIGFGFLAAVRSNAIAYVTASRLWPPIMAHLLRWVLVGAAFWCAVRVGGASGVLLALLGFISARIGMMRFVGAGQ